MTILATRLASPGRRAFERRRLARQDLHSAQSGELHLIRVVVTQARGVIASGWVQHGWFGYLDERGDARVATGHDLRRMASPPIAGACLVGAIVEGGGGVAAAHSQTVQRALDLTWHTLLGDQRRPVAWCPPPAVRLAQIRELTRWNDHPSRTADEVSSLLRRVEQAATVELGRHTDRTSLIPA